MFGWRLQRNALAPGVPLEGTDTVEGLRNLERLRLASLLNNGNPANGAGGGNRQAAPPAENRRRRYQRYKGPFLEQLSVEDLKKDPKPWSQFSGITTNTTPAAAGGGNTSRLLVQGYTIPASLDLLYERVEENAAFYCTNYLRCLAVILMLTLYLRPIAVVGTLILAVTLSFNINTALEMQQRRLDAANSGGGGAAAAPLTTPQSPLAAVLAIATWIAVAYTRCMPIILLGLSIGLLVCLLHASLHTSPSEQRRAANPIGLHFHRNRAAAAVSPHSYTLRQVLGRQPVPPGCDPRLLFRQVHRTAVETIRATAGRGRRWFIYYSLLLWDTVRRPFVPALRSAPNTWT